jgi:hypothetical protein
MQRDHPANSLQVLLHLFLIFAQPETLAYHARRQVEQQHVNPCPGNAAARLCGAARGSSEESFLT